MPISVHFALSHVSLAPDRYEASWRFATTPSKPIKPYKRLELARRVRRVIDGPTGVG
ncbi:hypothetical protein [Chenggangzhangella methanolivorans]|uniref:Uncharacterized protein n=1 Tax=Chenggangzhangella methanolivorans TaxID=1437009 RepID=A0A9E6R6T5_9HYPH|nr:hypothetical protein [Chenggangzhangella methanolivorans]QZN98884.1 hypothetical protein K6K41_18440 [Chenggangzhangella methanolivorans]